MCVNTVGATIVMGIECSTYVLINRGTSKRSHLLPMGNTAMPSVACANMFTSRPPTAKYTVILLYRSRFHVLKDSRWLSRLEICGAYNVISYPCRSILLLILAHILNAVWLVEQPGSSLVYLHERFQFMLRTCASIGARVALAALYEYILSDRVLSGNAS